MKVILCGGPKGGQMVDWGAEPLDGEVRVFDRCHYRADYAIGQAVFVGQDPEPRPTTFVSAPLPADEKEVP
jgi:hypothetical protein